MKYRIIYTLANGDKRLSSLYDSRSAAEYDGDERCLEYNHNMIKNPDVGTPQERIAYEVIEVMED